MSDLLLMGGGGGLPRSGLVGLWDPYRDAYGRNVLATNIDTLTGWTAIRVTLAASSFTDTTDTGNHGIYRTTGIANGQGRVFGFSCKVKASNGMVALRLGQNDTKHIAIVNLTTGATVLATGCAVTVGELDGDGYRRVAMTVTSYNDATQTDVLLFVYAAPTNATSYATLSYTGSAETPITVYAKEFKLDLGYPTPYSAPAGAPGTLQTMADYHGSLYPLQLGSGATADAADPAFTGVSMLHAADYLLSGNLAGITMAGDWTLPLICKPSGTANTLVSLASAAAADQYQAIEYNGSTKVRIKTVNGATVTTSDDLTVSATAVQMLILTSSGDTLTLKRMDTGTSVTATNADPTGTARLCIGALGVDTVATPADALEWHLLPLYGRAWTAGEAAKAYAYSKSLMARRGVTLA